MKNTYYITTPIYYVNDIPHIGHAYTSVAADVIARNMRLWGKEVMLLTGTDEHGQKVEKSAIAKNIDPQTFVDNMSLNFSKLTNLINMSNDDFIRTTEHRHKEAVTSLWQTLLDSGNIYLGSYKGWYSIRDETFYDESELTSEGLAPTGAPVEWIEEPSYFFALSKWQDKLLDLYSTTPEFIIPNTRRNEVISFVKSGLRDLSISRTTFKWGIKVPNDEKHVIYVWLDALTNYISALGYPQDVEQYNRPLSKLACAEEFIGDTEHRSPAYSNVREDSSLGATHKLPAEVEFRKRSNKFWPADAHIVGKDILRFHAVYWPAFLMAAQLPLPKSIVAHGWWTNEGQKISKSVGNAIDPVQLINEFGLDQVRYYLMREVIFGSDAHYSRSSLINRVNSELSNKIGNLLQRALTFVYKNMDGKIPLISQEDIDDAYQSKLIKLATQIISDNLRATKSFAINSILENIITLVEEANIQITQDAPWHLKELDPIKMNKSLYTILETLRYVAIMLQPFMPNSANKMLDQLNVPKDQRMFKHLTKEFALIPGSNINIPEPIFPRL